MILGPEYSLRIRNPFKEKIVVIREMGINPLRLQFVTAILAKVLFSKSPLERKLDLYKRWGWSGEEVLAPFKMYQNFLLVSWSLSFLCIILLLFIWF